MKEIKVSIPEYINGLRFVRDDHYRIRTSAAFETLTIEANRAGLISLARHLLYPAQEEVPTGSHIHLDEYNALEDGSVELIIFRNDDL